MAQHKDGKETSAGSPGLTYRSAGVDIDEGMAFVNNIKPLVEATKRQEVLEGLGGFAGLFAMPKGYQEPVLVSGTDGVGTKVKVAFATGHHDTVGIDLVAMCVNDIATTGAEPLFFLDYFASGKLDREVAEAVVSGIAGGCRLAGCSLVGGETAEMPGFYPDGEYDLSGFAVGVVEREKILTGKDIHAGDVLVGVASSGLHSNGFSLAREALFSELGYDYDDSPGDLERPLGRELLEPTRIYVRTLREALEVGGVKAAAHITGGGLLDNPVRPLPKDQSLGIKLRRGSWPVPAIFGLISAAGVNEWEMYRTFNMGLGLLLFVSQDKAQEVTKTLSRAGEAAWIVGEVVEVDSTLFPVELV